MVPASSAIMLCSIVLTRATVDSIKIANKVMKES